MIVGDRDVGHRRPGSDPHVGGVVPAEEVVADRPPAAAAGKEVDAGAAADTGADAGFVVGRDDIMADAAGAVPDCDAGRVVLDDVVIDGYAGAAVRPKAAV